MTDALDFDADPTLLAASLEGLAFNRADGTVGTLSGVLCSTSSLPSGAEPLSTAGTKWIITFSTTLGDVPTLIPVSADLTGSQISIIAQEIIRGQSNSFTIEPRKADGSPVRDLLAPPGFEGADYFLSEMWENPEVNGVEGTHTWLQDEGRATYNGLRFEIQRIRITPNATGTFRLQADTTEYDPVYGQNNFTAAIAADALAVDLKYAMESLDQIGQVDCLKSIDSATGETWFDVTFKSRLGNFPLLNCSSNGLSIGDCIAVAIQDGITEVQTVTTSGDDYIVPEVQAVMLIDNSANAAPTGGAVSVSFGGESTAAIPFDSSESVIQAHLESLGGINMISVQIANSTGVGASGGGLGSGISWMITFLDPIGNVEQLQIASVSLEPTISSDAFVDTIVEGAAAIDGSFMLQFGAADGTTTDNLASDATAEEVQVALDNLATIGPRGSIVHRTRVGNGFRWTVTFANRVGNLPALAALPEVHEIQQIQTLGGNPTPLGGTFRLQFLGELTPSISFDASAAQVAAAVESLSTSGRVEVSRAGPFLNGQFAWTMTFRGVSGDLPLIVADTTGMTGSSASISVTEVQAGNSMSLIGRAAAIRVEEEVGGLPTYTGHYTPRTTGLKYLAVRQLTRGGLLASYFDNQWLDGQPIQTRVDPTIDFDWVDGLVTPFGRDYVSVRWAGKLVHPEGRDENATLYLSGNEGLRMYFDHALVIDRWNACCQDQRANVHLVAGKMHDILVEFKEVLGTANIKFEMSTPSISRRITPSNALYHAAHIVGSPFQVDIIPGAADFPFTTAFGPGIANAAAGIPAVFYIQAKDREGNNKTTGDDAFDVQLVGSGGSFGLSPTYVGAGLYSVEYTVFKNGNYTLSVRTGVTSGSVVSGGEHIRCGSAIAPCSPFSVVVAPGPSVGRTSEIAGSALRNAVAGQTKVLTVQARDTFFNNR